MGFYSTVAEPQKVRQEKLTCTQKTASREIFCYPIKSSPKNRLETPELHQRNRLTTTKIASGILYWPSTDPDRGPFPSRKKPTPGFHIISHPANATTCYAKTAKGPIRGPSSERPPENEYVYDPKRDVWVIKTREVTEKCYCCKENSSESK